jgi:hypothetical protein
VLADEDDLLATVAVRAVEVGLELDGVNVGSLVVFDGRAENAGCRVSG